MSPQALESDLMSQPLTPSELAAFRARQKSRSRALALVLVALAVLFFAVTIVKIKGASDARHRDAHIAAPSTAAH
jgi:hypothetical protein